MAKQIIVTQNDYGIELETQFVDDKKKPLNITDYDVRVNVIYDDKTIDTVLAEHKDSVNGIAYIVLEKEHLINVGLHTSIWSVVDEDEHVTAQEDLYYFVKETKVSSDNNDNEDNEDIIEDDKITIVLNKLSEISEEIKDIEIFNVNTSNEISALKTEIPNIKNSLEENRTTLSSLSSSVTQNYQTKTSDNLKTTSKNIVGAINEIKDFVNTENSMNENGYYKLPNGLIMQWGSNVVISSGYEAETRITLPKSVQKIFCPMVTLHDMEHRVVCSTYDSDTTGFTLKLRSVASNSGTGHGIGAIRINWFALCK